MDPRVEVAAATVEVLHGLHILVQLGRPEDHAALLAQHQLEHVLGVQLAAGDRNVADAVLPPFVDMDGDQHAAGLGVAVDDPVLRDVDIEESLVAVVVHQLADVVLELVVLEPAGAGQPGEHPPPLGIHLLAEVAGLDVIVPDKADIHDPHPFSLADLEGHDAVPGGSIPFDAVGDLDLIVAFLLIEFVQLLGIDLDRVLVQRDVGLDADLLLEPGTLISFVALEPDRLHAELRGDLEHEVHPFVREPLALDFDELEQACAVE